jgi:hypothetical protein
MTESTSEGVGADIADKKPLEVPKIMEPSAAPQIAADKAEEASRKPLESQADSQYADSYLDISGTV